MVALPDKFVAVLEFFKNVQMVLLTVLVLLPNQNTVIMAI
jgi:hypothetical protein